MQPTHLRAIGHGQTLVLLYEPVLDWTVVRLLLVSIATGCARIGFQDGLEPAQGDSDGDGFWVDELTLATGP